VAETGEPLAGRGSVGKLARVPTPIAHHLLFRLSTNTVLARTPAEQRALARAVLSAGREADLFALFAPGVAGRGRARAARGA
jgi:hypothetical protein